MTWGGRDATWRRLAKTCNGDFVIGKGSGDFDQKFGFNLKALGVPWKGFGVTRVGRDLTWGRLG